MEFKKNKFIKISLIITIIIVFLDIVRDLLNIISPSFLIDNQILYQILYFSGAILSFIIIFYYLFILFEYLANKSFLNIKFYIQIISLVILTAFLIFEIIYLYKSEFVGVLSVYKKMFPLLFSGFIIGFLYLFTLNLPSLKQIKYFNIYLVLIILLIILTPLSTDSTLLSETKSNINKLFNYLPIISDIMLGMVFVILLSYLSISILSILFVLILFNFIKAIIKKEAKINIKENIVNLISTLIVTGFYISMIPMWVKFVGD